MFILTKADTISDGLRWFFSGLDRIIYQWLAFVTNLAFTISAFTVNNDFVEEFTSRIYVILAIFTLFKLAISLLNGIINPDSLTDKNAGIHKIISRVLISLSMLVILPTLIFPFMMDKAPDVAAALPKIILGVSNVPGHDMSDVKTSDSIGTEIASTTARAFITVSEACTNSISDTDASASSVLELPDNLSILDDDFVKARCGTSKNIYAYEYNILVSSVVGLIMFLVMLGFCLDFAVRSIKLCVLQVLAPIPIISYIDPKSEKDGAFAGWLRNFISTYLELFIKLAIVYFIIFFIQQLCEFFRDPESNKVFEFASVSGISDGLKNTALVFLIIGLLFFARQAPKFISDILGIKGSMGGSIGLGGLLAGTAALIGGAGVTGAASAAVSQMGDIATAIGQGKQAPGAWSRGSDLAAQLRTGNPNAKGGLFNSAASWLQNQAAAAAAAKAGLSEGDINAQKDALKTAKGDYDKASYAESNIRSEIESMSMPEDPGAWSGGMDPGEFSEAEPTFTEAEPVVSTLIGADNSAHDAWEQRRSAYQTAHSEWEQRKATQEAAHVVWQQQRAEYDQRVTERRNAEAARNQLYSDLQKAHEKTLAAQETVEKRQKKLDDAKSSRKTIVNDKSSEYNARNPFEHD